MTFDRSRLVGTAAPLFVAALLSLFSARQTFAADRSPAAGWVTLVDAKEAAGLAPRVEFQEWATPAKGEHPHDPLATADGAIWYTGQRANLIGRVDPSTGNIKEFGLREPNSGPHGLVAGKDGAIWFTAQSGGYIGRLDPRTGEVRAYFPKDAQKIDPHTPIFDRSGVLWFTAQSANMIGRLDPAKGEIELMRSPTKDSAPYGVVVGADGALYVAEFGANK
ncbi:MAG TPA: hypothetical protein VED87_08660, partial [Methylocystis sp.]|nr:hypothetical protein [Methylocystis sp.]